MWNRDPSGKEILGDFMLATETPGRERRLVWDVWHMKPQEAKVLYDKGEFLIFSILPEADPPPKAGRAPLAEKLILNPP